MNVMEGLYVLDRQTQQQHRPHKDVTRKDPMKLDTVKMSFYVVNIQIATLGKRLNADASITMFLPKYIEI